MGLYQNKKFCFSVSALAMLCLLFFSISLSQVNPAAKKDLERKRNKLLREIEQTNKQLQQTEKNKNATQAQLDALRKKIKLREQLIGNINSEIGSIGKEISSTGSQIQTLDQQLTQLKKNYADMIRFAQANRNQYQSLAFVFASDDFNQAYKRMKYLQQYSEFRKEQAVSISKTGKELSAKKSELEQQKKEKTGLKVAEEKHRKDLEKEKGTQDKMMANLQASEKTLTKQLQDKIKAKEKLDKAIESIIRKEIAAAKKKAVQSGKKNVTTENVFSLTPEAQKLSATFASNKGSLPWPVEQGRITDYFGEHAHPQLKNITVKNDGIDIQTTKGGSVRSVFNGEVSGTVNLPGGSAIIIRHGEYLSVYSNVEDVFVKKGDKVTTKQKIGTVRTSSDDDKAKLNLQIWKGFNKLNPQPWLAKK